MAATGNSSQFFGAPKWVTGTTYAEGTVVWSPSDTMYYIRKNGQTGAGSTDPASDTTNWLPTGGRAIKSVQRGTATATTTNITISAVVMGKTTVQVNGSGKDDTGVVKVVIGGFLTSTTNIATAGSGVYSGGGVYYWEAVETY